MVPGDKGDPANFRILESMPVRSIITNPANGAKFAAGTKELKLRGASWAGDLTVKQVDVSTDFGASWQRANLEKPKNKYRLAALDRDVETADRRLFRDLDARHRFQGRDAAASGRLLESAGLRRQRHAPHRGAGRLMRRIALAVMAGLLWMAPATAQSSFTPRDESPEDFPAGAGRDETFYACTACHGFKLVAQQGMTRAQWDDSINLMIRRHNMPRARRQGSRRGAELSRGGLSAARASRPWRLAEPVREVKTYFFFPSASNCLRKASRSLVFCSSFRPA